jgi:hypothetical protein
METVQLRAQESLERRLKACTVYGRYGSVLNSGKAVPNPQN